jgi:hypothetical protein
MQNKLLENIFVYFQRNRSILIKYSALVKYLRTLENNAV